MPEVEEPTTIATKRRASALRMAVLLGVAVAAPMAVTDAAHAAEIPSSTLPDTPGGTDDSDPDAAPTGETAEDQPSVEDSAPPPAETAAPAEPTPPAQTAAPAEPTPPAQTAAPAEPTPPAQTAAPAEPTPPAQTAAPAEPTPPAQTATPPAQTATPTEPTATAAPTTPATPTATAASTTPAPVELPTNPIPAPAPAAPAATTGPVPLAVGPVVAPPSRITAPVTGAAIEAGQLRPGAQSQGAAATQSDDGDDAASTPKPARRPAGSRGRAPRPGAQPVQVRVAPSAVAAGPTLGTFALPSCEDCFHYRTVRGDSLWVIADEMLGEHATHRLLVELVRELRRLNGITPQHARDGWVEVGIVLALPKLFEGIELDFPA